MTKLKKGKLLVDVINMLENYLMTVQTLEYLPSKTHLVKAMTHPNLKISNLILYWNLVSFCLSFQFS